MIVIYDRYVFIVQAINGSMKGGLEMIVYNFEGPLIMFEFVVSITL
jgi:hypothetical protein